MDAYSMSLKGKQCVICPDKDDKGEEHREKVMASIADYAKSVRYVKLPDPYKDVTEMFEAVGKEKTLELLIGLFDAAVELIGGMELPVYSMDEAEAHYIEHIKDARAGGMLDLGCWLPTLGKCVRPLVPGDFVVYLANTGAGKTAALQNICMTSGLESLFFELEVTRPTIFERFAQISTGMKGEDIEKTYEGGGRVDWKPDERLSRIHICDQPKMTTEQIEKYIIKSELKIGRKPRLVVVDYIQLIRAAKASSRYERFSDIAENLKVIAKATGTIVIAASQISRKGDNESPEVFLHDAKESGSIENSAGLILGGWLDDDDRSKLTVKVLKCTRGRPGARVTCNFFGENMRINERARTQDIPV
jgi:replicative DNA helicase